MKVSDPLAFRLFPISTSWSFRTASQLKGELTRISFENFYIGSPAWTPDGRAIVFSGGDFHNPSLWKIALGPQAGKPERLAFAGEGAITPAISRQGRLAYGHGIVDTDI